MNLTMEQMRDLLGRLDRLSQISAERDRASAESYAANQRWNAARTEYAKVHAGIVATYGEQHAPVWIDRIHGPRATVSNP